MNYCPDCAARDAEIARLTELVEGVAAILGVASGSLIDDATLVRADLEAEGNARLAYHAALGDREAKYHDAMAVLSEWGNVDKAAAIARAQTAEAALGQMQEALRTHGVHGMHCLTGSPAAFWRSEDADVCDCGLGSALKQRESAGGAS